MKSLVCIAILGMQTAFGQSCAQVVPVRVIDRKTDSPISGLQANMLHAKLKNIELPITDLRPISHARVLVLLDKSGSMEPQSSFYYHYEAMLGVASQAIERFALELPRGSSVQFGMFAERAVFTGTFDAHPIKVHDQLQDLATKLDRKKKATSLYNALHESLTKFEAPAPGDTIVVFTDGGDNTSNISFRQIARELQSARVRLFVFLVQSFPAIFFEVEGQDHMAGLAKGSGGGVLQLLDNNSWVDKKTVSNNIAFMRHFWEHSVLNGYFAEIQVPTALLKNSKWTLEGPDQVKHKASTLLFYPQLISPCTTTPAAQR